jgi:hypothetical protein
MPQPSQRELRWGDLQTVNLPSGGGASYPLAGFAPVGGNSLVWAVEELAMTWSIYLQLVQVDQLGLGGDELINVTFNIQMGTGAANLQTQRAAQLSPLISFVEMPLQMPARVLQIQWTLQPGLTNNPHVIQVGGMAAPLVDLRGAKHPVAEQPERHPQWMPPGFEEDPLRYR